MGNSETKERPQEPNRRRTTQINQRPPDPHPSRPRPVPGQPECRGPPGEGHPPGARVHSQGDPGPGGISPTGTFTRGGRLRSSLPVVRSPNKSLERPMGLIFLTFRNETKRALLPNEVTSLDTVKALFVRSFCDTLSMQWFEIPGHKVYILDQSTNVYYELDNVSRDVKDRAVLKVYETEHPHGPPPSPGPHAPQVPNYLTLHGCQHVPGYESDSSVRSAPTGTGVRSPLHHPPLSPRLYAHHQPPSKAQNLADHLHGTYACPQQLKSAYSAASNYAQVHHPPGGQPHPSQPYPAGQQHPNQPHPAGQPHPPQSHWSPRTQHHPPQTTTGQFLHPSRSNQSSPQRALPGNQRHSLAYLPDSNVYQDGRLPQSRSYHDYHEGGSGHTSGTATPTRGDDASKNRMDQMEAQLANLAAWVQTTVMKTQSDQGSRPGSARSNSSVVSEGSYSAKSMSDVSTATPQPVVGVDLQEGFRGLHNRARELKSEVKQLRRLQVTNMETMRDTIRDTYNKLKDVIDSVPGAADQPLRARRRKVDTNAVEFRGEANKVHKDLADLEISVEELRNDVLSRKCRINMTEVENMALALSTITAALGDLKTHFPALQVDLKAVMQGEMQVVVQEEKFLREEPERLDASLKRCKKVTGTLATMRRLALVQEHKSPLVPALCTATPKEEDRLAVLENIKAMVPDHDARVTSVQAAEDARERKKKIDSKGEILRFEKSLAMAQKQLKEPGPGKERSTANKDRTPQNSGKDRPQNGLKTLNEELELSPAKSKPTTLQKNETVTSRAPQKPPRAITPDKTSPSAIIFGVNGSDSFQMDNGDKSIDSGSVCSGPKTSAFESSVTSAVIASPGQSIHLNTHAPLSPSSTSTPKSHNHIAHTMPVTEISANSSFSTPGQKKIPPPPPPRRSSRTVLKTPSPSSQAQPSIAERPTSPHMYENIEKLNIVPNDAEADAPTSNGEPTKTPNGTPRSSRPKSTSDIPPVNGNEAERPTSQYSPSKMKQLNKFQQELAAGIYSNLNRPELQHQKVDPSKVVGDGSPLAQSPDPPSSNSSSSTSLDSQLGGGTGTIKRNKNYMPEGKAETTESQSQKARKIPPPPPQRKCSTLTLSQEMKAKEALEGSQKATSPTKSKLQDQYDKFKVIQKDSTAAKAPNKIQNGGVPNKTDPKKSLIPNGTTPLIGKEKGKKFEETDIY